MKDWKRRAYWNGVDAARQESPRFAPFLVSTNRSVLTILAEEWYKGFDKIAPFVAPFKRAR